MKSLVEIYQSLNEQKYRVYHGSRDKFYKFNWNKTYQRIAWFTDSRDYITSGDAGAHGRNWILTFDITLNNPAGWDEYEKLGIGQLRDAGYDGVILPDGDVTNYIVFDNKNIKYVSAERNG